MEFSCAFLVQQSTPKGDANSRFAAVRRSLQSIRSFYRQDEYAVVFGLCVFAHN